MHQYIDKKKNILFLFLILFFLSSINSQKFVEKKKSFYNLQSIEVIGLDNAINLEIKQKVYNKIEEHRKKGSIVSSNTSTIPRAKLVEGMPKKFSKNLMFFMKNLQC